jgi:hypothetical protein
VPRHDQEKRQESVPRLSYILPLVRNPTRVRTMLEQLWRPRAVCPHMAVVIRPITQTIMSTVIVMESLKATEKPIVYDQTC